MLQFSLRDNPEFRKTLFWVSFFFLADKIDINTLRYKHWWNSEHPWNPTQQFGTDTTPRWLKDSLFPPPCSSLTSKRLQMPSAWNIEGAEYKKNKITKGANLVKLHSQYVCWSKGWKRRSHQQCTSCQSPPHHLLLERYTQASRLLLLQLSSFLYSSHPLLLWAAITVSRGRGFHWCNDGFEMCFFTFLLRFRSLIPLSHM